MRTCLCATQTRAHIRTSISTLPGEAEAAAEAAREAAEAAEAVRAARAGWWAVGEAVAAAEARRRGGATPPTYSHADTKQTRHKQCGRRRREEEDDLDKVKSRIPPAPPWCSQTVEPSKNVVGVGLKS